MTTRCLTVITPLHAAAVPYIGDAYESIRDQELPAGWEWEWAIQCDGPQEVPTALRRDPRCSIDTNRPSGAGATRTMALARTAGDIVRNLDADDQLTPGALARDVAAHEEHPEIGWTTAPAYDLSTDGDLARWHDDPRAGVVDAGWVVRAWEENDWAHLPSHAASLCIRRGLLALLGGWMALPTSEDTGLLLSASAVAPGYLHREPGMIYRKHPGQVTATAEHLNPTHAEQRLRLMVERAHRLAGSGLTWSSLATAGSIVDNAPT